MTLALCSGCGLPSAALVTCYDRGQLWSYCFACWAPPRDTPATRRKR